MIMQTATVLKALGEPTRLTIMKFLSLHEMCICELTAVLDMSQPRVSQHMKVLRHAGLVAERRFKQKSYYRINPIVLNGFIIEPFRELMQIKLDKVPELGAEIRRFKALDGNLEVQDCLNGCCEAPTTIVKII